MPSMPWSKGHSQSNRSSTSLTLSPSSTSANTRPTISAPLPPGRVPQGFPQAGRVSSGGVEQRLIPIERGAAELNNNNDASPSSASSASSYIPSSARKFLHRDRERQQGGPPSPQPDSSTFGVSRRSSLLGRSKPTPNPPQLHRQPDNDNRDLYLQQSPVLASHPPGSLSRPQSMLPSPLEAEIEITYSVDHNDTDSAQHYTHQKHHDGYQRPNTGTIEQQHGQQNYYDQGSQQYQQDHQQSQHQQQGNHMMPAPPHNPSRRSMDASHQSGPPGPPSREVSGLTGLQSYAAQQGGRGTDQQAYQTHGAGSGGGQPQPAYDPAKFEGQPTGRVMTPEQARVDSRASQAPEVINVGVLLQDHEILQGKYRKVKNLYFDSKAEIERLQNTLAHQRLSQSRTSLDDNEYISRFERLDGAIKNVAFEIRQSWKSIPPWLRCVINSGAELKGGREMTVVGRASISRWVLDEIFEQFFHPSLDVNLSMHLKLIENNIRNSFPQPQSIEEDDALSTKVCNWRITTLDALQSKINGNSAIEYRSHLSEHLVKTLVEKLQQHLHEPAPVGLLGGVQMIVDIAVGLAANLPLESRDVKVWYPLPGAFFDPKYMKGEALLPPLLNPAQPKPSEGDEKDDGARGVKGGDSVPPLPAKDDPKNMPSAKAGIAGLPPQAQAQQPPKETPGKKAIGSFGKMKKALQGATGNTTQTPPSPNLPQPRSSPPPQQNGIIQVPIPQQTVSAPQGQEGSLKQSEKVRVAGFMAIEVRGRSILVKAPVWL